MSWVEFPVLRVVSRTDWEKELGEGRVAIVPPAEGVGRVEKRQIDEGWAGRKKMKQDPVEEVMSPAPGAPVVPMGLAGLGEYESDEDEVDEVVGEEVTEEDIQIMRTLGAAAAADMA